MNETDACCFELVLFFKGRNIDKQLKKLSGKYRYQYSKARMSEIENGRFTFRRRGTKGYIFKSQKGFWSVSRFSFHSKYDFLQV